jgi:magnesium-protoporphyrin O-methyltransferase
LIQIASARLPLDISRGAIQFVAGDMLDPTLGKFDFVVAMDSVIHYRPTDVVRIFAGLAMRTRHSLLVTFAPRTAALTLMHTVGRAFPHQHRAPAIEPIAERNLKQLIVDHPDLEDWSFGRSRRVASSFYKSHALELTRR